MKKNVEPESVQTETATEGPTYRRVWVPTFDGGGTPRLHEETINQMAGQGYDLMLETVFGQNNTILTFRKRADK